MLCRCMFLTGLSLLRSGNRGDFAALMMLSQGFISPSVLFKAASRAVNNTINDCFLILLIRANYGFLQYNLSCEKIVENCYQCYLEANLTSSNNLFCPSHTSKVESI